MSSSFKRSRAPVKAKTPSDGDGGPRNIGDFDPVPLFRVGEIWDREAFKARLPGDHKRKFQRLVGGGLHVLDLNGTGLVLIDELAEMIRAGKPLPVIAADEKRKAKRKRKRE